MKLNEMLQNLIQCCDSAQTLMKLFKELSQYLSVLVEKPFMNLDQEDTYSDQSVLFTYPCPHGS
jgi:hypothetical protein